MLLLLNNPVSPIFCTQGSVLKMSERLWLPRTESEVKSHDTQYNLMISCMYNVIKLLNSEIKYNKKLDLILACWFHII